MSSKKTKDLQYAYEAYVPEVDPLYVPFGEFEDIVEIIHSCNFFPIYITGLSGNGKTFMVEQACAKLGRKIVRVNITKRSDEDELFGGFRLINGETKWFEGQIVKAMKEGAILLLDEVDLASVDIMCLQPVLEGKGVLLKKINEYVKPAPGFNIIATANTKGQGEGEKFIGTQFLNEAFLERFAITIEQTYPEVETEKEILRRVFVNGGVEPNSILIEDLVRFASEVRKSYYNQGFDQVISTRRLVHIVNGFLIFKDIDQAMRRSLNRYDNVIQEAFSRMWESCRSDKVAEVEEEIEEFKEQKTLSLDDLPELEPLP